jgi:hypothetical protein
MMTNDSPKEEYLKFYGNISVSAAEHAREELYASTLERDKRLESHALAASREGDDEGCWMAMATRAENARFLAKLKHPSKNP